jgi:hypothetical protein
VYEFKKPRINDTEKVIEEDIDSIIVESDMDDDDDDEDDDR